MTHTESDPIQVAVDARQFAEGQLRVIGAAMISIEEQAAEAREKRNRAIILARKHGLLSVAELAAIPGLPNETYIRRIATEERA